MDPKWKAKWVEALRSGEYAQGRGTLCSVTSTGDEFCCLGVLCDLYARRPGSKDWWGDSGPDSGSWWVDNTERALTFDGRVGLLPLIVESFVGLQDSYDHQQALMEMNDGDQATFTQIADWIEENL